MPESGRTAFTHAAAGSGLDFRLLRDLQRVIDHDAEVSDGAFQLGVSKQQLNGAQILHALVDQRHFGSPHRVRPVGRWIKPGSFGPAMHDPRVLAG